MVNSKYVHVIYDRLKYITKKHLGQWVEAVIGFEAICSKLFSSPEIAISTNPHIGMVWTIVHLYKN